MHLIKKIPHKIYAIHLVILLFLLAKNPFSTRTLIPNLEPYPDTIYYISSAMSFIKGETIIPTTIPPLYSLFLLPFFVLKSDARMFYVGNAILSLASLTFFYLTIRRLARNNLIMGMSLFLYVTNYFIYWYPSLAMAENLTLTLFNVSTYLLLARSNKRSSILSGILVIAFYMTKYASLPLSAIYFFAYSIKVAKDKAKNKLMNFLFFVGSSILVFLIFSLWEFCTKGSTLIATIFNTIGSLLLNSQKQVGNIAATNDWFSFGYLSTHLPEYLRAIVGGYSVRFLWEGTPLIPFFVGSTGILGLFIGLRSQKTRHICGSLIGMLFISILFMSTFYAIDMRYLYHAIPTLIIGFVIFWETLKSFVTRFTVLKKIGSLVFIGLLLFYFTGSVVRLKTQISINLRYAETPWYYLSVIQMNEYFKTKTSKKPYVITAMIPYYVDYFSNHNYKLLPLSPSQDFFKKYNKTIWGKDNYSDLTRLYQKKISQNNEVYLLSYLGSDGNIKKDMEEIQKNFSLTLVKTGCYGSCNIWKINIK